MSLNITEDRKMKDLIGRVGDDVSQLRSDITSLFSHTGPPTPFPKAHANFGSRQGSSSAQAVNTPHRICATSAKIRDDPPSAFSVA